jgi:hypothetical protein
MISNSKISVTLTPELRLEQALKKTGVEDPLTVKKLTINGKITETDFAYIGENLADTLQELDMGDASVEEDIFNNYASVLEKLSSIIIPKSITYIDDEVFTYLTEIKSVTIPGRFLSPLAGFLSEDDFDD